MRIDWANVFVGGFVLAMFGILVWSIIAQNRIDQRVSAQQAEFRRWCASTGGRVIIREAGGFIAQRYPDCIWPPR